MSATAHIRTAALAFVAVLWLVSQARSDECPPPDVSWIPVFGPVVNGLGQLSNSIPHKCLQVVSKANPSSASTTEIEQMVIVTWRTNNPISGSRCAAAGSYFSAEKAPVGSECIVHLNNDYVGAIVPDSGE